MCNAEFPLPPDSTIFTLQRRNGLADRRQAMSETAMRI